MNVQWTAAIIGIGLAVTILVLVRRDRLHGPYALWWLLVALAALVMGLAPQVVDWLGRITHVFYPPVLPIIVGLSLVLVRLLKMDIDRSHQERRLRRMIQKVALLESELADLREARQGTEAAAGADPATGAEATAAQVPERAHAPPQAGT